MLTHRASRSIHWLRAAAALLCNAFLFSTTAMGQETANEIWPELDAFLKISENSRLFLLGSGTRTQEQGYSDGALGVHIDLFTSPVLKTRLERAARHTDVARSKFLQFRIGYLYSRAAKSSSSQFAEHTPTVEATPRYYFPKHLLVTNRVRGDFRFLDGVFTPRLRERLKLERTFRFKRRGLTPYGHAEAFYDWRYHVWHRFRYTGGVEWELNHRIVLEGYYVRQRDNRSSTKYVNAAGIVVQLYFP